MPGPIKILIIGNGFGGVYTLRNIHKLLHHNPRIELSLIGENNYFLFTPLLHEVATGGISPENIIEPIRKVLGCCIKNFYLGTVQSVNLEKRTVKVGNSSLLYDYLVIAAGAKTNFYGIPGAEKYSLPLKSLDDAIKIKNKCIMAIERASHTTSREIRRKMLRFIIVGGGPTGVELAAELYELIADNFSRYYPREVIEDASVVLIQKGPELIHQFKSKMRKKSLEVLQRKGIKVMLDTGVVEVKDGEVVLDDGTSILTETVIWVAGIKPVDLEFDDPSVKSSNGRIKVNEYLQLKDYKEVFALGDIAAFVDEKSGDLLPALAQVAEKEAKVLAKNIKLIIGGKKLKPFFYYNSGTLLSLGRWMAIGEIADFTFSGRFAWWVWRTIYLSKLISFRKKVKVAVEWTINIFSPRDISKL